MDASYRFISLPGSVCARFCLNPAVLDVLRCSANESVHYLPEELLAAVPPATSGDGRARLVVDPHDVLQEVLGHAEHQGAVLPLEGLRGQKVLVRVRGRGSFPSLMFTGQYVCFNNSAPGVWIH